MKELRRITSIWYANICFHHVVYSRAVISIGVEEEDKKHTWMADADAVRSKSLYLTY